MKLNENDERIMAYIQAHLEEIPHLSSRELSRRVYSNPTSIIRLVRKLGYDSYNDFKLNIVRDLKQSTSLTKQIERHEDVLSLVGKVAQIESEALKKTQEALNTMTLQAVFETLKQAKCIDLYANDTNASLAHYASHLFFLAGKLSHVYDTPDLQLSACLLSDPSHVAFIISKYAKNHHLLTVAKTLGEAGIPTIALTSDSDNALASLCTQSLVVPFSFTHQKISELDFYRGVTYYLHLCYVYLYSDTYETSLKREADYNELFWK